jgi:hypothetical protein
MKRPIRNALDDAGAWFVGMAHIVAVRCAGTSWRRVVKLWAHKSARLLWGSLIYNLFAILVVRPLLARLYPDLTPWEHVRGFFSGHTRTTYKELLPYVGPGLWVAGNAFLFALMNHNFTEARRETDRPGHHEA